MSGPPPAPKGSIKRTGLLGYVWIETAWLAGGVINVETNARSSVVLGLLFAFAVDGPSSDCD